MPIAIDMTIVRQLLENGAQLVDVLPAKEFAADHLPSAINIPLTSMDRATTAQLRQDQPVIVYCHDHQ
ncbi:MAG TPA: rhodanese-like domain-containing protein [Nitrolancea sp.]|nr:rhodanese-like domain-containing protein [Nitrolancea sp.]